MTAEGLILHILGTGGGRHVMISQRRRTAGLRLVQGDTHVHIDPGPGGLVFSNWANLSTQKLSCLIITHCHPDHYSDAEVFIEAMTRGTTAKQGILAGTKSVIRGANGIGPCISNYHKNLVRELIELREGIKFDVGDMRITATKAEHSDPFSVGLRIETPFGDVGYTSDTGYFPGLSDSYRNLELLLLCTMWPRGNRLNIHLNTDDALKLIMESQPKVCLMTHFGMRMLNADPEKEAEFLASETGIPVYAAADGLQISLGDQIILQGPRKKDAPIIIEK